MAKLSRVSAGKWNVGAVRVSCGSMEEAVKEHAAGPGGTGAAVYFEVRGEYPFTSMVVFRPDDIETISRGFLGFSFSKLPNLNQAQEMLLSELGNILLNALISSLSNALKEEFPALRPEVHPGRNALPAGGAVDFPGPVRAVQPGHRNAGPQVRREGHPQRSHSHHTGEYGGGPRGRSGKQ